MAYCSLTENTQYLKDLGIGAAATDAMTATEAASAEQYGDNIIHEKLGTVFENESGYPPAIVDIALMLASAQAYRFVYSAQLGEGTSDSQETSPAWQLEKRAIDRLDAIADGGFILKADGATFVDGYGPTDGGRAPSSIDEEDEDVVFDPRAVKPEDLRTQKGAYDWPALTGDDD